MIHHAQENTVTTKPSPLGTDDFGRLINKISIDINLKGEFLPRYIYARDWASASAYLDSDDFAAIADRVQYVTLTNREA